MLFMGRNEGKGCWRRAKQCDRRCPNTSGVLGVWPQQFTPRDEFEIGGYEASDWVHRLAITDEIWVLRASDTAFLTKRTTKVEETRR